MGVGGVGLRSPAAGRAGASPLFSVPGSWGLWWARGWAWGSGLPACSRTGRELQRPSSSAEVLDQALPPPPTESGNPRSLFLPPGPPPRPAAARGGLPPALKPHPARPRPGPVTAESLTVGLTPVFEALCGALTDNYSFQSLC